MKTLIASLFETLRRPRAVRPERERWTCDPLGHPDIAAMDLRQLADLPAGELRARGRLLAAHDQQCHGHLTSGGMLERMELTLPPVFRPKMVPRS